MSANLILLIIATAVTLPAYTLYQLFHSGQKPAGIQWGPSGKNGLFAALDSSIKTTCDICQTLARGSMAPSARSHGFLFSTVLDGVIVALPLRNLKWLAHLPETTASFYKAHEEHIQMSYTIPAATLTDPELTKILFKVLTRRSKSVVPAVHEEIEAACQSNAYGGRDSWQSLCLYPEIVRILTATSNRMLVGLPLCRDPELLSRLSEYAQTALPAALLIRLFPPFLRAAFGRVVRAWRIRRYHHRLLQILVPPLARLLQEQPSHLETKPPTTEQSSFASWWQQEGLASRNSRALDPVVLAKVIIQLNFAGLHATSLTTTTALYHILSHTDSQTLVADLRREVASASTDAQGHWTWADLEKMELLDSVVRESLRCAPIDAVTVTRSIVEAVTTPDGLLLPAGTRVCVPGYLGNLDATHYSDAATFDPYRFVEARSGGSHEKAWLVTENFTTFGFGLHVCPGRWFAIAEMKLVIAHLLTSYDFEALPRMPIGFSLGTLPIPSTSQQVRVRQRREGI